MSSGFRGITGPRPHYSTVRLIHLLQVVKVKGTFGIHTLVDHKKFPVLLLHKRMTAVRAAETEGRESVSFVGRESCSADFAPELTFGTVVFVKIDGRCLTPWTDTAFRDITVGTAADGFYEFPVAFLPVGNKILIRPFLVIRPDLRQFVSLELLILWGVGVVKSLLLQGDISADKEQELAILLVKMIVGIDKKLYNIHTERRKEETNMRITEAFKGKTLVITGGIGSFGSTVL